MSEVFGDDFPDCRPTPADRVKAAGAVLLAVQESSVERAHAEATLAVEVDALAREVARLDAHLQTCEACHHVRVQQLQARVAELEQANPTPTFRHLYRQDQAGVGTECGRPWTNADAEGQPGRLSLPVCWACVRTLLDRQEAVNEALRREVADQKRRARAVGERNARLSMESAELLAAANNAEQSRDQLVQAVRVAIREAVPGA